MNKFLFKKIKFFISSLGYKKINIISEIKEGRNSQVYKLKIDENIYALKIYRDKKKN